MAYNNAIARFCFAAIALILVEHSLCADYNWSANLRYRLKTDTSDEVEADKLSSFSEMRSRIGLDILGEKINGYFIIQDSRVLGAEDNSAGITGRTLSPTLHQVYFTYNTGRRTYQIGRFELALGNQRIIAKNNWNNTGRSFEGILVKRKTRFGERLLFTLPVVESYNTERDDSRDHVLSGVYWNVSLSKLEGGSRIEPYIINYQQAQDNASYNMVGCRADLEKGSLLFEGELAMQSSNHISASMLSLNLGYTAKQFEWLRSIKIGVDLISGDDAKTDELEGFSKYFGARHKHHGYYDYGLHKKYFGHKHQGLQELNLKGKLNFLANSNLLVAMHSFGSYDGSEQYGSELDLIVKKKFSDELTSEIGFALYSPESDNNLLTFMYMMLTASL